MSKKQFIVDPSLYDVDHVIADIEEIRKYNPQRYEMEQLTAIVYEDTERHACVGYKDLAEDEFWVRGHMPDYPLMPGVIMCEAAAQMSSYYVGKYALMKDSMVGFGGLEEVRFRGIVRPGQRFIIQAQLRKIRPGKLMVADFQCLVDETLVCNGIVKGIPLPVDMLKKSS